jgi:hypothetical protein
VIIKVRYSSVDGYRSTRPFKTLKGARKFAQARVGKNPEMGSTYAVSGDGIGKIQVEGAKLSELFGDETPAATGKIFIVNAVSKYFATRGEAEAEIAACIAADPTGAYGPYDIQEEDASDFLPSTPATPDKEIEF